MLMSLVRVYKCALIVYWDYIDASRYSLDPFSFAAHQYSWENIRLCVIRFLYDVTFVCLSCRSFLCVSELQAYSMPTPFALVTNFSLYIFPHSKFHANVLQCFSIIFSSSPLGAWRFSIHPRTIGERDFHTIDFWVYYGPVWLLFFTHLYLRTMFFSSYRRRAKRHASLCISNALYICVWTQTLLFSICSLDFRHHS